MLLSMALHKLQRHQTKMQELQGGDFQEARRALSKRAKEAASAVGSLHARIDELCKAILKELADIKLLMNQWDPAFYGPVARGRFQRINAKYKDYLRFVEGRREYLRCLGMASQVDALTKILTAAKDLLAAELGQCKEVQAQEACDGACHWHAGDKVCSNAPPLMKKTMMPAARMTKSPLSPSFERHSLLQDSKRAVEILPLDRRDDGEESPVEDVALPRSPSQDGGGGGAAAAGRTSVPLLWRRRPQ
jgi:hypothetical protein